MANSQPQLADNRLTIVSKTKNSISLRWTKATDKETPQSKLQYTVTWCVAPYVWDNNVRKIGERKFDNTSYTITGLTPNTTYDIYLYVRDEGGYENVYAKATVTTLSDTVPGTTPTTSAGPKKTVTYEPIQKVYGPYSFHFQGNYDGCKVVKTVENLGDGEIGGGDNYAIVDAKVVNTGGIVKLVMTYIAQEPGFRSKSNQDSLQFVKEYQVLNLNNEFKSTTSKTGNCQITRTYKVGLDTTKMQAAYYKDKVGSGEYKDYKPYNYNCTKRDWLPWERMKVKADGSGKELTGKGNIGVKGEFYVYVKGQATVTTVDNTPDTSSSVGSVKQTIGTRPVISNLSSVRLLDGLLGNGYDICGKYADMAYVKESVLDLNKLNADKHINCVTGTYNTSQRTYKGESIDEYTKDVTSTLKVEVSGNIFGASFSSSNTDENEVHTTSKNKCKFFSAIWKRVLSQYSIQITDPCYLWYYVRPEFLEAAKELKRYQGSSYWDTKVENFINQWGTHVLTGVEIGGSVNSDYIYKQHVSSEKTVHSFKTVNSIGYSSSGAIDKNTEAKKKSGVDYDKLLSLLKQFKNIDDAKVLIDYAQNKGADQKSQKSQDSNNDEKPKVNKGWGINASGTYETKEEEYSYHEDEIEISNSETKGGTHHPDPQSATNAELNSWFNSINASNAGFIDFMPGKLIPIYTLVYDKTLSETVRQAWLLYCKKHSLHLSIAEKGVKEIRINVRGTKKGVQQWNKNEHDFDVYATKGTPTAYKLSVDLVNLEESNQAALSIYYQVAEGKKGNPANIYSTDYTNICFVHVVPLDIPYTAVDTERVCASGFSVTGSDDTGGVRINATSTVKSAIDSMLTASDRKTGRKCPILADSNHPVYVHLDGAGEDQTNIGYEFTAYIPYLKYEN